MPANAPDDEEVARVVKFLAGAGVTPVLIGGMAMTVFGSTRATMDCDYALEKTDFAFRHAVQAMFDAGYGMIFKWNDELYEPLPGGVESGDTAKSWAAIDRPESLWFWHDEKKIRIDLVFDLPVPIDDLRARATRISIAGQPIYLASLEDLLRMKETSVVGRTTKLRALADEQDLVFLRGLIRMKAEK